MRSSGLVLRVVSEFHTVRTKNYLGYISLHGVYKYTVLKYRDIEWSFRRNDIIVNFSENLSTSNHIYGLQAQTGYKLLNTNSVPWIDIYIGLGCRYEIYSTTVHSLTTDYPWPEEINSKSEKGQKPSLTFHLGIRTGVGFKTGTKSKG